MPNMFTVTLPLFTQAKQSKIVGDSRPHTDMRHTPLSIDVSMYSIYSDSLKCYCTLGKHKIAKYYTREIS